MTKNPLLSNYWKWIVLSLFTIEILEPFPLKCIKYIVDILPTIMNEIFTLRHQNQYNLRNWTYFDALKVRTVNHGSESVRYLVSKIWEIIPVYSNELDTIDKFKIAIKKWKPKSCPCRLCRVYLQNIGYL